MMEYRGVKWKAMVTETEVLGSKRMNIPYGDRDQQKKEDSKSGGEDVMER